MIEDSNTEETPFQHSSANNEFMNRVNSIFGSLDTIEKKYEETAKDNTIPQDDSKSEDFDSKTDFKRPRPKAPIMEKINTPGDLRDKLNKKRFSSPGHIQNPDKWQKYSLEDDGTNNVIKKLSGDQLNKKIALDFITNLKPKADSDGKESTEDCKIVFKTPQVIEEDNKINDISTSLPHSGQAIVMKEYDFGCKKAKGKQTVRAKEHCSNSNEVALSYIDDGNASESSEGPAKEDSFVDDAPPAKTFVFRKHKNRSALRKKNIETDDEENIEE